MAKKKNTDKIQIIASISFVVLISYFIATSEHLNLFSFVPINVTPDKNDWIQLHVQQKSGNTYLIQGYVKWFDASIDRMPYYEIISDGKVINTINVSSLAISEAFSIFPVEATIPSENKLGSVKINFVMGGDRGTVQQLTDWKTKHQAQHEIDCECTDTITKLRNDETTSIAISVIASTVANPTSTEESTSSTEENTSSTDTSSTDTSSTDTSSTDTSQPQTVSNDPDELVPVVREGQTPIPNIIDEGIDIIYQTSTGQNANFDETQRYIIFGIIIAGTAVIIVVILIIKKVIKF